jgi:hypothetical protein
MPAPWNYTQYSTTALIPATGANLNAKLDQLDLTLGDMPTVTTTLKTAAGAINQLDAEANWIKTWQEDYSPITWDRVTKILTFTGGVNCFWGDTDGHYLAIRESAGVATFEVDLSALGANDWYWIYVVGAVPGSAQTLYTDDVGVLHVEARASVTHDIAGSNVCVLALFDNNAGARNRIYSPCTVTDVVSDYLDQYLADARKFNPWFTQYLGGITWNRTTRTMTIPINNTLQAWWFNQGGAGGTPAATRVTITFAAAYDVTFASGGWSVLYVDGLTPGASATLTSADFHMLTFYASDGHNHILTDLWRKDVLILAVYQGFAGAKSYFWTPFLQNDIQTEYIEGAFTEPAAWVNLYPNILPRINNFAQKLMYPTSDVHIVLWGDSIMAAEEYTSAVADVTSSPPAMPVKNLSWYLWSALPQTLRATYRRYDYNDGAAYFTFVGTWVATETNAAWDDSARCANITNYTTVAEAGSVAWTMAAEADHRYTGCNLVYRTSLLGEAAATIAVAEGAGFLEKWDGAAWVEANGTTMSFVEVDEGSGYSNSVFGKRLRFRKATAHHADAMTVTIAKAAADGDELLVWGVELYNAEDGHYIAQVFNASRGGGIIGAPADASIYSLTAYMEDAVIGFEPDLVIFELPLINMVGSLLTKATMRNSVQDCIWGNRSGSENVWALMTRNPAFDVVCIIPHLVYSFYTAANLHAAWGAAGYTFQDAYDCVKALFQENSPVPYIDMSTVLQRAIDQDYHYKGAYRSAYSSGAATGDQYTYDGTHQNDKGTLLYARHLCPAIMDVNSV